MFVLEGRISVNKTNPAIRWTVIYLVDSVIQSTPAGPGVFQELTLNNNNNNKDFILRG